MSPTGANRIALSRSSGGESYAPPADAAPSSSASRRDASPRVSRYNKTAATPPSSGYAVCNQSNQYTRWVESYSVVLLPSPSSPFSDPAFTDDDSDTPGQDQVGILLGTVAVDPNSVTLQFSSPTFHNRHFLGVIAQRIQTPPGYDATQSYQFLQKNTAHSPAVSLAIEPNIFARQNLILGPDFDLTGATIKPAASTNTSGSAKVASDLFVQGNLYSNVIVSGVQQWLGVSQYVQTLVQQFLPEIVIGQTPVAVNNTPVNAGLAAATAQIAVNTTRLTNVSSAIPLASFSQIQTADQTDLNALFATGAIQIGITTPPTASFVGQNGNVNVSWQAGPASGGPPTTKCAIQNFTISCVVICFP